MSETIAEKRSVRIQLKSIFYCLHRIDPVRGISVYGDHKWAHRYGLAEWADEMEFAVESRNCPLNPDHETSQRKGYVDTHGQARGTSGEDRLRLTGLRPDCLRFAPGRIHPRVNPWNSSVRLDVDMHKTATKLWRNID